MNILVARGRSSEKTTFMDARVAEIDPTERVLTVEDTEELKVKAPEPGRLESNMQHAVTAA